MTTAYYKGIVASGRVLNTFKDNAGVVHTLGDYYYADATQGRIFFDYVITQGPAQGYIFTATDNRSFVATDTRTFTA